MGRSKRIYLKIEHKQSIIEDLIIVVVDNVGARPCLGIFIIPFEGVGEGVADGHSESGAAGLSDDSSAAVVEVDDFGSGLFFVAKFLWEGLVEEANGGYCWVIAVLAA